MEKRKYNNRKKVNESNREILLEFFKDYKPKGTICNRSKLSDRVEIPVIEGEDLSVFDKNRQLVYTSNVAQVNELLRDMKKVLPTGLRCFVTKDGRTFYIVL